MSYTPFADSIQRTLLSLAKWNDTVFPDDKGQFIVPSTSESLPVITRGTYGAIEIVVLHDSRSPEYGIVIRVNPWHSSVCTETTFFVTQEEVEGVGLESFITERLLEEEIVRQSSVGVPPIRRFSYYKKLQKTLNANPHLVMEWAVLKGKTFKSRLKNIVALDYLQDS